MGKVFDSPQGWLLGEEEAWHFYPKFATGREAVQAFIEALAPESVVGLDVEFDARMKPTVLGLGCEWQAVACHWDDLLARHLIDTARARRVKFVAHSAIDADRRIINQKLGIETPVEMWECSMLMHYLAHTDLVRTTSRQVLDEDDPGSEGSRGAMNLWIATSLVVDVPYWKDCDGGYRCERPCPSCNILEYCAMDAWASWAIYQALKGKVPWELYRRLLKEQELLMLMSDRGIRIDRQALCRLETQMDELKEELFGDDAPFNPRSPKAATEYFEANGIKLKSTSREDIETFLVRRLGSLERVEEVAQGNDPMGWLARLYLYKKAGKGLASWFAERYLDADDLIHPRFAITGTITGRLSSSNPNFQNVPARGWGARVRSVVIPRSPDHVLVSVDSRQLELRMCLFAAGRDPRDIPDDAFTWLLEQVPELGDRQTAKSVSHAGNYLEGILLLKPLELEKRKYEIEAGALLVYRDWEYMGHVVCFNGANLARRLFGSAGLKERRRALEIQEIYFRAFPEIRQWQKKVSDVVASRGEITSICGRRLRLFSTPVDDLKTACSFIGQGQSADYVQEAMVRIWEEHGLVPLNQIHDELLFELPKEVVGPGLEELLKPMVEPGKRTGEFCAPARVKYGNNWYEMQEFAILSV